MANRYSVYKKKDDMPVVIYATSDECASAMKIKRNSFYKYICRMRGNKIKTRKWIICKDEMEEWDCA